GEPAMASIPKSPHRSVFLMAVLCAAFRLLNSTWILGQDGSDSSEAWLRAEHALEILATGKEPERMEIAEDPRFHFRVLVQAQPDERILSMLQILRGLVQQESNDWIATSLLEHLGEYEKDSFLNDFYLDALWSGSPNRIWIAAHWFGDHEDERAITRLESLWPKETRPWVRTDFIKALAHLGSSKYLDDFMDLAASADPHLSSAAVGAL